MSALHPLVALMRRYVIDYTSSHDLTVCDEIMAPDYAVHIAGTMLRRDEGYKTAVATLFADFPGLDIQVHELFTDGEQLAMRFSEHGASLKHQGRRAAWAGIGLYRWNGSRLVSNFVEQDFFARRRQLRGGPPAPIEPPHHDPWLGTTPAPADAAAETLVRQWLEGGMCGPAGEIRIDDLPPTPEARLLDEPGASIDALFSAGHMVAFRLVQSGGYRPGMLGLDAEAALSGRLCELSIAGIAEIADGAIRRVRLVTDRLGLVHRLAAGGA